LHANRNRENGWQGETSAPRSGLLLSVRIRTYVPIVIKRGDQGEVFALAWLGQRYEVAVPLGNPSVYDLLAEINGAIARIQVKTTRCFRNDRWAVTLATRGGNQSWSGLVKRFSSARCEFLYVHTHAGRRWFIPATQVEGGAGLCLGGPKYAEYEVDLGPPLAILTRPRRDTEAVKRGGL
jgi:hypothetical protein